MDPQQSHRRRLSTLIFSSSQQSQLDGSLSPNNRGGAAGAESPSSSPSQNSTLKPPSTPTNNTNRNSFGFWGGSKSAASTPNLSNSIRTNDHANEFTTSSSIAASSPTSPSESIILTQAQAHSQGSGVGSAASMESRTSFQQRRKRSESTGGLKNTAGNISRIVKKGSSNFLRKFVKSFDDKDAPPMPNSSSASSYPQLPLPHQATRAVTAPQLQTLSSPTRGDVHIGPLDTPPPLSPLLGQELETQFSSIGTPFYSNAAQEQRQLQQHQHHASQGSNHVESWLMNSSTSQPPISGAFSPDDLTTSLTMLSQEHSSLDRYPSRGTTSCISDDNTRLDDDRDDDYDEDLDEDEDEDMPANISNRLSKLYESGSIQMNQSQTSLYYSTKSTLSEAEAAEIASRRTSLAQDALGYSLGLSRGNSIRFSQYSIGSLHSLQMAPMQPFGGSGSGTGSMPSSPGLARSLPENLETRPLPRRPVSLFIPSTTSAAIEDDEKTVEVDDADYQEKGSVEIEQEAVTTRVEAVSPAPSSTSTLRPCSGISGLGSMRPITICVGPEDANKLSIAAGTTAATSLLTPDMTSTDQREAAEVLALRTAKRCFDEDESFLKRDEIAEYMGAPKSFNQLVLGQYMNHFDFSGKRLDIAFRALCQKLVLKGETQEVDRILEAFADRYVRCNPRSLLGGADHAKDVVHAITYSILLLNTDLYVVQQSSKMSRSAFVKNTLRVVQAQAGNEAGPDEQLAKYSVQQRRYHGSVDHDSSATLMAMTMLDPLELSFPKSTTGESTLDVGVSSTATGSKRRTPSVKSWKSGHSQQSGGFSLSLGNHNSNSSHSSHGNHNGSSNSKMGLDPKANGGYGNGKWWHQELESLLKDIYTAVKQHQILLPVSPATMRTSRSKSNASLASPPTSPTASGFGSSLFSSNRMSRLIYPLSSSSSSSQQLESNSGVLGGSTGAFGLGLSGRRNSVSARSKQLRNEAIQRLNAQAQAQAHGQPQPDTNYLTTSTPSSFSPLHTNPRYSIAGSIFNEAIILDQHRGPTSSKDLSFLRAAGNQSQHSSSSRLSSLTSQISMSASVVSTSGTTPSASQNSLASLQEDPICKKQLLNPASPSLLDASQFQQGSTLQPEAQAIKDQLHQQHIQSRYRIEGILWRKHLLERTDKKAQHRAWRQLLVVLDHEQGSLSMFRSDGTLPQIQTPPQAHRQQQHPPHFMSSTSSTSLSTACIIENDSNMPLYDEIPLQHTITNILPAPGYSDTRKYVFALQLYTGAVYLFQAQTPEDCEAWTRSCNYWAARTSKEPLVGGVVNMEYGWGRALDIVTLSTTQEEDAQTTPTCTSGSITSEIVESSLTLNSNGSTSNIRLNGTNATTDYLNYPPPPSSASSGTRSGYFGGGDSSHRGRSASIKSGTRGSMSSGSGGIGGGAGLSSGSGNIPLGDRVTLFEWTAPMPTMTRSLLSEEEQMLSLKRYVAGLGSDLDAHQEHRAPMTRLFLPKSNNYAKAFANWEKRSKHLLKEIIKWQIYVECLEQSQVHFQLLLQQFDFDCQADDADQTHPFEDQQQTQQQQEHSQGYAKDDVEAELERLVVHEGLRSVIV
ncbi:hypothetical protein BGZ51_004796 [Haplosporangium sp. Z 767]|nr:hypothetical protein BGZ51_004796 [Haplosporangium sp. Z 767]KAF9183330.1 hypothetical protein BGZ50_004280 [Haplosporangium sp. Z 11]